MHDENDLSSRITRVELFREQALISRRVKLAADGTGGQHELRLPGLPMLLRNHSVRVDAGAGVRLLDVHVELDLGRASDAALRTEGEESLRELHRKQVDLSVAHEQATELVGFLESLQPSSYSAAELPEALAFGERHQVGPWLEFAASIRDQLAAARTRIRQLDRQQLVLQDSIAMARDRLERESAAEAQALATSRKAARLTLETSGETALELGISYLVPLVRWVPEYELRVYDGQDQAELVLKALVGQATGEDWSDVSLSFSTADLARSADLPRLDSWRIGKAQPPSRSGWRELPDTTDELFEDYDRGIRSVASPPVPATPELPEVPRLGPQVRQLAELVRPAPDIVERLLTEAAVNTPRSHTRTSEDGITGEFPAVTPEDLERDKKDEELLEDTLLDDGDDDEDWEEEDMTTPTSPPMADLARSSAPMSASDLAPPAPAMKKRMSGRPTILAAPAEPEPSLPPASFFAATDAPGGGGGALRETRLVAGREALIYDNLRLQGPRRRARGNLMASGLSERLAQQLEGRAPGAAAALRSVPGQLLANILSSDAGAVNFALPRHGVPTEESAGHFAVRYEMESPGQVLSDGQPHLLTLLRRQGYIRRVFRCVPLLDTNVYQLAQFENPLDLPLLAGPVRVYREGDFVVSGPLDTTPPGKAVTVNLGVEPGISVARNTHFLESTHGLFGGDTGLTHKVEIEVRSRLSVPAQVELIERVPVSYDDDIEVKLLSISPRASDYNQKDRGQIIHGGKLFSLDLAPGESQTCSLEYRITIPSKRVLEGGNRRD